MTMTMVMDRSSVLVCGEMVTALLKSETGQEGKTGRTNTRSTERWDKAVFTRRT